MEEIERIQEAVRSRQKKRVDNFVNIGQAAEQFFAGQITPQHRKYGDVLEIWEQVLPEELSRHCEIVNISGGNISIKVDSPAYKYELQLCSHEILRELQKECPKARLTKIKLI